jgi:transcriptional regulator with XRE-family HTH domain
MGGPDMGPTRNCAGCGKPLSRYNTGNRCQACISAGRATSPQPAGKTGGIHVDAARLAQLRRDRGWTQDMLAGRAGLSREVVRKLEQQARRSTRISTLSALAEVLNVPVSVLLGEQPAGQSAAPLALPAPQTREAAPLRPTLLRELIGQRHWQRFQTFRAQFQRAAQELAHLEHDPDLAKLTVSSRQWERWYSGQVKTEPYPDACRVLEHMFGYPIQQLLAPGDTGIRQDQDQWVSHHDGYASQPAMSWASNPQEDHDDMERRRLLQNLAALGVAISPAAQSLETIRSSFGAAFGHDDRDHLEDWENAAIEYGYSYLATSPMDLIPDLAADLIVVRSIAARLSDQSPEYRGWCRVGGILSGFMAKSLSNLGNTRVSRHWWDTAQHMVDSSGDLKLSMWVRGQRIIHGLYENRPTQILLCRAKEAAEFAHGHVCAGLADASTGLAQVSVLTGDYMSAAEELRRTQDILSCLPTAVTQDTESAMGWGETRLRYTQAWVYAHMGDERKTDEAAQRALNLFPESDTRSPAQVKLIQAFARVRRGDIGEGIRHAQAVYAPLVSGQRTTMVDVLAQRVLADVPAEAQNRPDVTTYRELVAPPRQRMIEA